MGDKPRLIDPNEGMGCYAIGLILVLGGVFALVDEWYPFEPVAPVAVIATGVVFTFPYTFKLFNKGRNAAKKSSDGENSGH